MSGYSVEEVGHMTVGRWGQVFDHYKKIHNMNVKRLAFAEPEKAVSVMNL